MATLPEKFKKKSLRDLKVGEEAYIKPWSMLVDFSEECFVSLETTISQKEEYNQRLRVTRSEEGFIVYCSEFTEKIPYSWKPGDHSSIYIGNRNLYSPVYKII